jgi:type II secretory pathway pseudopilin PulG
MKQPRLNCPAFLIQGEERTPVLTISQGLPRYAGGMVSPPPRKRGFSLIEAAIVLGVVGLVIGGIWVAAADVSDNIKANRLYTSAMMLNEQLQPIITRAVIDAGWGYGNYVSVAATIGNTIDGITWDEAAAMLKSDYGNVVFSGTTTPTATLGDVPTIAVEFWDVPRATCIRVAERFRVLMEKDPSIIGHVQFPGGAFAIAGVFGGTAAFYPGASVCTSTTGVIVVRWIAQQR